MFYGEKIKARIKTQKSEIGTRKDEEGESYLVLSFSGTVSNDMLVHIDATAKSRIFKKEDQPDVVGDNGYVRLAMPWHNQKFTPKDQKTGVSANLDFGVGDGIKIDECTIYGCSFTAQEGGTIVYSFKLKSKAVSEKDVANIHSSLLGNEVGLTLTLPQSPQVEIEGV